MKKGIGIYREQSVAIITHIEEIKTGIYSGTLNLPTEIYPSFIVWAPSYTEKTQILFTSICN